MSTDDFKAQAPSTNKSSHVGTENHFCWIYGGVFLGQCQLLISHRLENAGGPQKSAPTATVPIAASLQSLSAEIDPDVR